MFNFELKNILIFGILSTILFSIIFTLPIYLQFLIFILTPHTCALRFCIFIQSAITICVSIQLHLAPENPKTTSYLYANALSRPYTYTKNIYSRIVY